AMPAFNFLPLGFAHSSRKTRKLPAWHPPLRFGPKTDAAPIASGLSIAIETAMVAARKTTESKENYHGEHRHLHPQRNRRFHRRNRHPQLPGQERPPRPRNQPGQRERPEPPRFCRPGRDWRRLA